MAFRMFAWMKSGYHSALFFGADVVAGSGELKMGRAAGAVSMLLLLLIAPLPVIGVLDIISGDPGEPLVDYLIAYLVLLIVFGSAAVVMLSYFLWKGLRVRTLPDVLVYALAGAIGATAFIAFLDASDDYFTQPGLGWVLPVAGFVLGSLFGAAFRGVCAIVEMRSVPEAGNE